MRRFFRDFIVIAFGIFVGLMVIDFLDERWGDDACEVTVVTADTDGAAHEAALNQISIDCFNDTSDEEEYRRCIQRGIRSYFSTMTTMEAFGADGGAQ